MKKRLSRFLRLRDCPAYSHGTLILAFDGWMDGGDVSTGTVTRLVHLLGARTVAKIDSELFYIYNFPGSMEVAALFRPHCRIEDGVVKKVTMPTNTFHAYDDGQLVLFLGKEPNLRWRDFGEAIFEFARRAGIHRIFFVGSFGGAVPHTRQPRLYVSASSQQLLDEMQPYGVRRSTYAGPGSFTSYLMTRASSVGIDMVSLVAEIPGYLQGANPLCIEAVTQRLAKIFHLRLDLAPLRAASTEWELEVTGAIEQNQELADKVRELEEQYDNELLELDAGEP
jgi:proteasome assembly chaperone (PAC2) family protein